MGMCWRERNWHSTRELLGSSVCCDPDPIGSGTRGGRDEEHRGSELSALANTLHQRLEADLL